MNGINQGRIDILKKLLTLSQRLQRKVSEEKWEHWDSIAREKTDLCQRLKAFEGRPILAEEKGVLDAILEVEKQTLRELADKREAAHQDLIQFGLFTERIKNYRHSRKNVPKSHLNIKC